jgi:uncharacterized membrane protein
MFNIVRIIGICLGFPLLLGYLWFFKYHGRIETTYFVTSLLAVWGVAVIPRHFYKSSKLTRHLVRIICASAVISTMPMIYKDITLLNGADFPAVVIRSIVVAVEIILLVETYKK